MVSKTATLTLTYRQLWGRGETAAPHDEYTVEQITDSVSYMPGAKLTKNEVAGLCENGAWKVIIKRLK